MKNGWTGIIWGVVFSIIGFLVWIGADKKYWIVAGVALLFGAISIGIGIGKLIDKNKLNTGKGIHREK